jgi:hypothetical protein
MGEVGKLDYWKTTVVQVIDANSVILTCGKTYVWLKDYPTKDLTTDQLVRIVDYVKVGEVDQHDGISVRTVTMLPVEETKKLAARDTEAAEAAKIAAQKDELLKLRDYRKWTAKNGNEIEAKFTRFKAPTVHLELKNGKKTSFRITALTDADAELVRSLAKEDAAK